jgi:hypothetical protein
MDPETGHISLPFELLAGGTAGGCQVVRRRRNPLRSCLINPNSGVHEPAGNCVSLRGRKRRRRN